MTVLQYKIHYLSGIPCYFVALDATTQRLTLLSCLFFRENLVMKTLLQPFFYCFEESTCQSIVEESALSTGKLPEGGLPLNIVVRIQQQQHFIVTNAPVICSHAPSPVE